MGRGFGRGRRSGAPFGSVGDRTAVARPACFFPGKQDRRTPGRLLSEDLDGKRPFLDTLGWPNLLGAAAKWGVALAEVVEVARPLAALGIALPPLDQLASFPGNKIDERLVELLSEDLDSERPFLDTLGWPNLLGAAAKWGVALAEVVEVARPLAALGIALPPLDQLAPWRQIDKRLVEHLSEDLDSEPPFLDSVGWPHLSRAARQVGRGFGRGRRSGAPFGSVGDRTADARSAGFLPRKQNRQTPGRAIVGGPRQRAAVPRCGWLA